MSVSPALAGAGVSDAELLALNAEHRSRSPTALLRWAVGAFAPRLSVAASFGVEDVVVIHLLAGLGLRPRIFFLDTGRLHPETYETLDRVRERYGLSVDVYAPGTDAVQALASAQGYHAIRGSPGARLSCCEVRKVEPLRRALAGDAAWITGLRQEQAASRGGVELVERDPLAPERLKINPLAHWQTAEVWALATREGLPVSPLHAQGYASIGCAPCTRAVLPGEPLRAGRWWWEAGGTKECGLHRRPSASATTTTTTTTTTSDRPRFGGAPDSSEEVTP